MSFSKKPRETKGKNIKEAKTPPEMGNVVFVPKFAKAIASSRHGRSCVQYSARTGISLNMYLYVAVWVISYNCHCAVSANDLRLSVLPTLGSNVLCVKSE